MKVVKKMLAGMLSLSLMCSMGLAMTASAEPNLSEELLDDPSFEAGDIPIIGIRTIPARWKPSQKAMPQMAIVTSGSLTVSPRMIRLRRT